MSTELIKELTTELDSSSETIAKLILALERAEAENKRKQERIGELKGHLAWLGWSDEGVERAKAEIDRLRTLIDGLETERTIREAYIRKLERESGDAGEGTE